MIEHKLPDLWVELHLLDSDVPEPWESRALCAQVDPEAFFPNKGGYAGTAKKLCMSCPVQEPCLEWALDNFERDGIWGGATRLDRERMWRERGIEVPAENDEEDAA